MSQNLSHTMHGTGIFTNIYHKNQPNAGKYTRHGWYGFGICKNQLSKPPPVDPRHIMKEKVRCGLSVLEICQTHGDANSR